MTGLTGRVSERGVLDRLVGAVLAGESRALVVRGDPGVGKTVLLDYLAGQAGGCRVVRAAGVRSETELAFAGLHQLCAPMLRRAAGLFADAGVSAGAGVCAGDVLRWGWLAQAATNALWADDRHRAVVTRHVQLVRDAGALDQLPIYLPRLARSRRGAVISPPRNRRPRRRTRSRRRPGPASRRMARCCLPLSGAARPLPSR